MREILFRGKSVQNDKWVEGYFVMVHGEPFIVEKDAHFDYGEITDMTQVLHETVSQYSGMKDMTGKRIYEGDVVYVHGSGGFKHEDVVVVSHGCFCMRDQMYSYEFTYQYPDDIEVVDNVWDHPNYCGEKEIR
jgi:hypothetical protein